MVFDTHAHYDDEAFDADRDEVLTSLPGLGVSPVLNCGSDLASSRASLALAEKYPFVYAAVGVHPEQAASWDEGTEEALSALLAHPKVRAVGEIGLDYYWPEPGRAEQKAALSAQLRMARESGLPVVIHDREAHGDALEMVLSAGVRGVFHCFSGSVEMAEILVKNGWYLGFGGVLTYKNARKTKEALLATPLDRILLETDCPYLSPVPHRGQRNFSGHLSHVAAVAAELLQMDQEALVRQTALNGRTLFGIEETI